MPPSNGLSRSFWACLLHRERCCWADVRIRIERPWGLLAFRLWPTGPEHVKQVRLPLPKFSAVYPGCFHKRFKILDLLILRCLLNVIHLKQEVRVTAHREGLIDDRLLSFVVKLQAIRNQIAHADTRRDCMVPGRLAHQTEQLCQLSAAVPAWGPCEPVKPRRRFNRRIYAAMLSGVLATELTFFDDAENVRVKSFELVRDYVFNRPAVARVDE